MNTLDDFIKKLMSLISNLLKHTANDMEKGRGGGGGKP